jgi:KDO2-lipid IV(A) lauroyltransferase
MKDKLLYSLYIGLLGTLARLPLSWLYCVSDALCWVMTHVWHYRRRVVRENLQRVFPDLSAERRLEIESAFYHHLCDIIVEIIKLLHISDDELNSRVEAHGTEFVDACAREGRPAFVLMGHYGNWEWGQQMYTHFTEPIICSQVYRPLRDKASDCLFERLRSRFTGICVRQTAVYRSVLRMKAAGTPFLMAFIADQHPNSEVMDHWTTFLGQDSMYITGAEELGRKIGACYFYLDIEQTSRGHYRMTIRPIEPVENETFPYTVGYLRMMEASILRQPELWLWSHRRWYISREEYNNRQAAKANPRLAEDS